MAQTNPQTKRQTLSSNAEERKRAPHRSRWRGCQRQHLHYEASFQRMLWIPRQDYEVSSDACFVRFNQRLTGPGNIFYQSDSYYERRSPTRTQRFLPKNSFGYFTQEISVSVFLSLLFSGDWSRQDTHFRASEFSNDWNRIQPQWMLQGNTVDQI